MADTAHKTAEEVMEHHDRPDVLADKIDQLAEIIRAANYMVAWTGAGISTSCGIPDFRGPNGVWTLRARGETAVSRTSTISASPSVSHMALKGLIDAGILKKLISSNTDGLHRRSGIHPKHISELHGNSNRARCNACGASYFVDGRVRCAKGVHEHETPFKCTVRNCSGTLCDTIINFGEYLEEGVPQEANRHGNKADVLLVLGTSLRVITCDAADVITPNGGSLVIVNLQTTPYDDRAALRIFATVDEVMVPLMAKLGLQIPAYGITRRARITYHAKTAEVVFHGCDEAGCPYAYANSASICDADGRVLSTAAVDKAAPFTGIRVPVPVVVAPADDSNGGDTAAAAGVTARQHFLKWTPTSLRGEPPCSVPLPAEGFGQTSWDCLAKMTLTRHGDGDGSVGVWDVECQPNRASEGKDAAAAGKRRPWYFPW